MGRKAKDERTSVAIYARVSTEEQDLEHQLEDLQDLAEGRGWQLAQVPEHQPRRPGERVPTRPAVYRETVSGVSERRPELERLRADAARHRFSAVLVWDISRLGRNALEVLGIAEELFSAGVGVLSYKEPAVDTTTPMGKLVLQVMAAVAEFERSHLSARTISGLEGARRRGVKLGRRMHRASPGQVDYLMKMEGATAASVAKQLDCSVATVRRRLAAARARKGPQGPEALKNGEGEGGGRGAVESTG